MIERVRYVVSVPSNRDSVIQEIRAVLDDQSENNNHLSVEVDSDERELYQVRSILPFVSIEDSSDVNALSNEDIESMILEFEKILDFDGVKVYYMSEQEDFHEYFLEYPNGVILDEDVYEEVLECIEDLIAVDETLVSELSSVL